jgi:hypothetical protein
LNVHSFIFSARSARARSAFDARARDVVPLGGGDAVVLLGDGA